MVSHPASVAGVGLGDGARGVGHGGAQQPRRVVHHDLERVDVVGVQVVDLGVDEVEAGGADPQGPVPQLYLPVHSRSIVLWSNFCDTTLGIFAFLSRR